MSENIHNSENNIQNQNKQGREVHTFGDGKYLHVPGSPRNENYQLTQEVGVAVEATQTTFDRLWAEAVRQDELTPEQQDIFEKEKIRTQNILLKRYIAEKGDGLYEMAKTTISETDIYDVVKKGIDTAKEIALRETNTAIAKDWLSRFKESSSYTMLGGLDSQEKQATDKRALQRAINQATGFREKLTDDTLHSVWYMEAIRAVRRRNGDENLAPLGD